MKPFGEFPRAAIATNDKLYGPVDQERSLRNCFFNKGAGAADAAGLGITL